MSGRQGKIYVVAMCGAGDRPVAGLGGLTPLEAAATEHLDALARRGAQAAIRVIDDVVPPESDSGAMALLGYDPLRFYTGRGPLEGFGMGFLRPGDNAVAFRINFACHNPRTGRLDRRTARDLSEDELQELVREVRERVRLRRAGVAFELTGFARHRGILCLRGGRAPLGGNVSNTDPGFRKVGPFGVPNAGPAERPEECVPLDDTEASANTAAAVNEFVRLAAEVLARSEVNRRRTEEGRLPANTILVRDGGTALPSLPSFREVFGTDVSIYGQIPAERGLCRLIGGTWREARQGDGRAEGFYRKVARDLAGDPSGVVFVHLKGPDEPGHDGRPADKVLAIEEIDRFFVSELSAALGPGDACVVTADHATPCDLGIHSADPVPALVVGPGVRPDATARLGEREAASGALPVRRAVELMPFLTSRPGPR